MTRNFVTHKAESTAVCQHGTWSLIRNLGLDILHVIV